MQYSNLIKSDLPYYLLMTPKRLLNKGHTSQRLTNQFTISHMQTFLTFPPVTQRVPAEEHHLSKGPRTC